MKLLPKSSEVVIGITRETHHLAQETCAPGFRRLFLLLRQSPATTQPRGSRKSARPKRFHSRLRMPFAFGASQGSITDPMNSSFRSHTTLWPRTARVSPSIAMELLQGVLSKPTSNPASPNFVQQSSIMVSSEALDPENRRTSSAYPKQLRDTASHVHAKFILSQLRPHTAQYFVSHHHEHPEDSLALLAVLLRSNEIQRSEVTCPKFTSRELQHHQLQRTATN